MITEDYVSFEVAKLLKEKGFNEEVLAVYIYDNLFIKGENEIVNAANAPIIPAPTLQMAMKWLREIHGLFIHIGNDDLDYWWQIEDVLNKNDNYDPICKSESYGGNRTYEEAVEAAIKYCLENLI